MWEFTNILKHISGLASFDQGNNRNKKKKLKKKFKFYKCQLPDHRSLGNIRSIFSLSAGNTFLFSHVWPSPITTVPISQAFLILTINHPSTTFAASRQESSSVWCILPQVGLSHGQRAAERGIQHRCLNGASKYYMRLCKVSLGLIPQGRANYCSASLLEYKVRRKTEGERSSADILAGQVPSQ